MRFFIDCSTLIETNNNRLCENGKVKCADEYKDDHLEIQYLFVLAVNGLPKEQRHLRELGSQSKYDS